MLTVGVLGCGRMGAAFTSALSATACPVLVATARPASAARVAASHPGVTAVAAADLVRRAELLVLAVPFPVALRVVAGGHSRSGASRVLVDLTNPTLGSGDPVPAAHPSAGEVLAAALPTWRVVKAFNTVPAEMLAEPVIAGRAVTLPIASEHEGAKVEVAVLARRLGFEPVDAGGIAGSRGLEALAVLLTTISRRQGLAGRVGFQLAWTGAGPRIHTEALSLAGAAS